MARVGYNNHDFVNLLVIYGECNKVLTRTCDTYATRYPEKPKPSPDIIRRLISNLTNFGSFKRKIIKTKTVVDNVDNAITVLAYFTAFPEASLKDAARDLGLNKMSMQRILAKHKWHPYSHTLVHGLKLSDYERRVNFAEFIIMKNQENDQFLRNIIWSDEAKFTKNGIFNKRNSHYWSDTNPHSVRERQFQDRWNFNVYCAVKDNAIVMVHFYDENLNGERYLDILKNLDTDHLERLTLANHRKIWYQHDGAPPHNHQMVKMYLNETFYDQWFGTDGPQLWPPRSPDLTPMDFFLWGYIKNEVYSHTPTTKEDFQQRVRTAFNSIPPDMIRRAVGDVLRRSEKCLEVEGNVFEHLLQ